jgi:HEAT repeat protein
MSTLFRHGPESDPARKRLAVIAQNLRDLCSRDSIVATAAGERLAELAPATDELLVLLNDRDQYIRAGAAQRLRHAAADEGPLVVEALRAIVHVSSDRVVEPALGSLGYLRATAALDDIRSFLEDRNPRVIHAAVYALGRLGFPDEGRHLVRFLAANEYHLVVTTLNSIVQLRYTAAVPAIMDRLSECLGTVRRTRQHFDLPRKLISALVTLKANESVPLLVRIAQEEIGVRSLAVQALIDLKVPEAAPPLLPLLSRLVDSQHEERLCTGLLHLMYSLDYRFALSEIRRFLHHRLPPVRNAAVKIISHWHDRESVERIRAMCHQDASAFVRPVAVAALGRLIGAEALPDFQALSADSNTLVRETVARAVGRLRPLPPEGRTLLEELRQDPAAGRIASNALAYHDSLGGEPVSIPLPLPVPVGPLPPELQNQATAARSFLLEWRRHLTTRPGAGALLGAIETLLEAVGQPPQARAA